MRVSFTTGDGKSIPFGLGGRLWALVNSRMHDSSFLRVIYLLFLLLYLRDLFVVRYPPVAAVGGISLLFTALLFPRVFDRSLFWLVLLIPNAWMILKAPMHG